MSKADPNAIQALARLENAMTTARIRGERDAIEGFTKVMLPLVQHDNTLRLIQVRIEDIFALVPPDKLTTEATKLKLDDLISDLSAALSAVDIAYRRCEAVYADLDPLSSDPLNLSPVYALRDAIADFIAGKVEHPDMIHELVFVQPFNRDLASIIDPNAPRPKKRRNRSIETNTREIGRAVQACIGLHNGKLGAATKDALERLGYSETPNGTYKRGDHEIEFNTATTYYHRVKNHR